jgi:hypothetical protein
LEFDLILFIFVFFVSTAVPNLNRWFAFGLSA